LGWRLSHSAEIYKQVAGTYVAKCIKNDDSGLAMQSSCNNRISEKGGKLYGRKSVRRIGQSWIGTFAAAEYSGLEEVRRE
jgi:hypothetical protein